MNRSLAPAALSATSLFARLALAAAVLTALAACSEDESGDGGDGGGTTPEVPATYTFESRFAPGVSSVNYSGQTARQVLISDLGTAIEGLTAEIDSEAFVPAAEGDVVALLDFYFRFDGDSNGEALFGLSTDPAPLQATWNDISANKQLVDKLAGNDSSTDHADWSTEFVGWSDASIATHGGSITSPEGLIIAIFETVEAQALARATGESRQGPGGEDLPVHVTATGVDLSELAEKFLTVGVSFSQGADDYLDDDIDGKGLLADNTAADGENPWTPLEHQWDEAFGYFGAAQNMADYTDEEIAARGGRADWATYHDTNGDGAIDLLSEYNFTAARYAAQRDDDAVDPIDLTGDAFGAFVAGRAFITSANGALSDADLATLVQHRDRAVGAWERAIAASVIRYLNDVLGHMDAFGTPEYSFVTHAKHWSEMKGLALGFQFNPDSPVSGADFAQLHTLMADAPVLATADAAAIAAYRDALVQARTLIGTAYGFSEANLLAW